MSSVCEPGAAQAAVHLFEIFCVEIDGRINWRLRQCVRRAPIKAGIDLLAGLHTDRSGYLEGFDFGPIDFRLTQPHLNGVFRRQPAIRSANIGEEVDIAQEGWAGNPSGGLRPHTPEFLERHVFTCNIAVNDSLGCFAAELHDHIADVFGKSRIAIRLYWVWREGRDYEQQRSSVRTQDSPETAMVCTKIPRN